MENSFEKVGKHCLERLSLYTGKSRECDFSLYALGIKAYSKKWFIVGLVDNKWRIMSNTKENAKKVAGHGYKVRWKTVIPIRVHIPHHVERITHAPHSKEWTPDVHITNHKGRVTAHVSEYRRGTTMRIRRFEGSRLTCVYKTYK